MAPTTIQLGSKKSGGALMYGLGALGTAFAVDYWLTNRKMEEELAMEADEHIAEEPAMELLELEVSGDEQSVAGSFKDLIGRIEDAVSEQSAETPAEAPVEEVVEEVVEAPIEEPTPEVPEETADEPTAPEEIPEVPEVPEKTTEQPKLISEGDLKWDPSKQRYIFDDSDTEEIVEESSMFPELPIALWKILLILGLAFFWQYGKSQGVFPESTSPLADGIEAETSSIPMLGFVDEEDTTALVPAVDISSIGKASNAKNAQSFQLVPATDDGEEDWGVIAVLALVMMIL